jgi:hypothetical protein
MRKWVDGDQTSFLDQVLASLRLEGASPGQRVIEGSPTGVIDPGGLLRAVRAQAAALQGRKDFVFQCRTPSLTSHAYASLKEVTPSADDLSRIGITEERHRSAAASPRAFLAAWMMSFPLTVSPEYFTRSATIFRMMKADPVAAQRFRAWRMGAGREEAQLVLEADTLQEALGVASAGVAEGAIVIGFTVRSCWDLQGPSHAIMGTVFHYRVVDLSSDIPRIFEVRSSVGGGSITGGLPDNLMACALWKQQTKAIEALLARPEIYGVIDMLGAAGAAERQLALLQTLNTSFAPSSLVIGLLHLGAMPYRFVQRYLPSAREGSRIGGRYVVKEPIMRGR